MSNLALRPPPKNIETILTYLNMNFNLIEDAFAALGSRGFNVPVGGVIMFSGNPDTLPEEWSLCDGNNGTPDLRNRFIVGSEGAYTQGDTGGVDSVSLTTAQLPSHNHPAGSLGTGHPDVDHTHGISHGHSLRVGTAGSAAQSSGSGRLESLDGLGLGRRTAGTEEISLSNAIVAETGTSGGATVAHAHGITGSTGNTGSGNAHENRPPYYALAYIMRMF